MICGRSLTAVLVVSALAAGGCGGGSSHGVVAGNVTLDGEPLEAGLIRFVPVDGRSPTADGTITNGRFRADVPLGDKRVEISAPKVVGTRRVYETPDAPTVDIVEELLPARYNLRSELTLTVTAGQQQENFELTSGK